MNGFLAVIACSAQTPYGAVRRGDASFCLQTVGAKPLLAHMAESLAGAGVGRLILMPDAASADIRTYVGDGGRWGLAVELGDSRPGAGILETLAGLHDVLDDAFLYLPGPALFASQTAAALLEGGGGVRWAGTGNGAALFRLERAVVDLVADFPGLTTGEELENALTKRGIGGPVDVREPFPVGSALDVWAANLGVLDGELDYLVLPGVETSPGVRRRAGVRLSAGVRLEPPVFLGRDCFVGNGACLGPRAVIGDGAVIEEGAEIVDAVVASGSYVGPELTVKRALVAGGVYVRCPEGTEVHVPDAFLLGEMSVEPGVGTGAACVWGSRLLGLAGFLFFLPLILLQWGAHLAAPGTGVMIRREVAGRLGAPGLDGEALPQTVTMRVYRRGRGLTGRLPALWDVVRGRVALVGPEPLTPEEAEALTESWMRMRFKTPPGLVQPWHAMPSRGWEDVEKRVMEVHYVATRTAVRDIQIAVVALARWFTGRISL